MNAIAKFRKCFIDDETLLRLVDGYVDQMYNDGKIPYRHIPARPDEDFDILIGELICRFIELKNGLLEYRQQLKQKTMGADIGEMVFGGTIPVDHRLVPIETEWYKPGAYFENRYEYLTRADVIRPGDEIENIEFAENAVGRWKVVGRESVDIRANALMNDKHPRIRRQLYPVLNSKAV